MRNKLLRRELCIGSWIQVGHPGNAEILARAGFAWIAADCEHGEVEDADLGNLFRAIRQFGVVPLVRVRENAVLCIRRALDLGAMGIIVPLVNSPDEAQRAVRAARYPPDGVRGFAYQRANNWGADCDNYIKHTSRDIAVIVMIESKEAVEDIGSILAVDGVDAVFVGPYDMSGSYGIAGQIEHPIIRDACRSVAEACRRAGKSAGLHLVTPTSENSRQAIEQGFTLLALGMDTVFLAEGAKKCLELAKS